MAKALGTTPEEEHRPSLVLLARVSIDFIIDHTVEGQYLCRLANKKGRMDYHSQIRNLKR
jgi:hypothetical protein